jgi:hypothetical protein
MLTVYTSKRLVFYGLSECGWYYLCALTNSQKKWPLNLGVVTIVAKHAIRSFSKVYLCFVYMFSMKKLVIIIVDRYMMSRARRCIWSKDKARIDKNLYMRRHPTIVIQ